MRHVCIVSVTLCYQNMNIIYIYNIRDSICEILPVLWPICDISGCSEYYMYINAQTGQLFSNVAKN